MERRQDGKVTPGQRFRPPKGRLWNNVIAAGEANRQNEFTKRRPDRHDPRPTNTLKIENLTGGNRQRGEVVCFADIAVSDVAPNQVWLKTRALTRRGHRFGVLINPVAANGFQKVQTRGTCLARVNIRNKNHNCARMPSDGSFVLDSSFSGPVDIEHGPATTGISDCVVTLNQNSLPVFKTPAGGIPARVDDQTGTADCEPYYIDDDGKLVAFKADDGTDQVAEIKNIFGSEVAGEAYILARDIFGVLAVQSEDCDI